MNTINLTTSEFRRNQKKFLDMAVEGYSIIIHKGKDMFVLNYLPVGENLDAETLASIEKARQQFRDRTTTVVNNKEELNQLLKSVH
jgi:hypothetical protein